MVLYTAAHALSTMASLHPVYIRGDIDCAPWKRRLFPTRIAARRFLSVALPLWAAPMARVLLPQHGQWAIAVALAYLPLGAYWASVLLHYELYLVHVWWLVLGAPGICGAYVLVLLSGDSLLRDAAALGRFKYAHKSA